MYSIIRQGKTYNKTKNNPIIKTPLLLFQVKINNTIISIIFILHQIR